MTASNPVFLNEERLKLYFKTFKELHELHAKQNENLRKLVENHEKRLTELTKKIDITFMEFLQDTKTRMELK